MAPSRALPGAAAVPAVSTGHYGVAGLVAWYSSAKTEWTTESRHAPRVNRCPRMVPSSIIPALSHRPRGGFIGRAPRAPDPVQPKLGKSQAFEQAYRLGAFALPPLVRPQGKADLRAFVLPECQPCRPHEFSGLRVSYRQHVLRTRVRRRTGYGGRHDGADLLHVLGLKAEMPGCLSVAVDLVKRAGIIIGELTQHDSPRCEPDRVHGLPRAGSWPPSARQRRRRRPAVILDFLL